MEPQLAAAAKTLGNRVRIAKWLGEIVVLGDKSS